MKEIRNQTLGFFSFLNMTAISFGFTSGISIPLIFVFETREETYEQFHHNVMIDTTNPDTIPHVNHGNILLATLHHNKIECSIKLKNMLHNVKF